MSRYGVVRLMSRLSADRTLRYRGPDRMVKGEKRVVLFLGRSFHASGRQTLPAWLACLLAAFFIVAAGCSAPHAYRSHPELPYRMSTIRTMGLLPPTIELQETLDSSAGIVRDDDWSQKARENVFRAITAEIPVNEQPLVLIMDDERDLGDMADLFSAVDYTIQRHEGLGRDPAEPLPGGARPFAYALGPARRAMEHLQVDAIWFMAGRTVLAPPGAQAGVAVLAPSGRPDAGSGTAALVPVPRSCELRAALVDMSGAVLFYGMVDEGSIQLIERGDAERADVPKRERDDVRRQERGPDPSDLRDPDTARRYVKALFSEFRKAVAQ